MPHLPKGNAKYRMTDLILQRDAGGPGLGVWIIREIVSSTPKRSAHSNFYGMRALVENMSGDEVGGDEYVVATGSSDGEAATSPVQSITIKLLDTIAEWHAFVDVCEADSKLEPYDTI